MDTSGPIGGARCSGGGSRLERWVVSPKPGFGALRISGLRALSLNCPPRKAGPGRVTVARVSLAGIASRVARLASRSMAYYLFDVKGWPQIVLDQGRERFEGYPVLGS